MSTALTTPAPKTLTIRDRLNTDDFKNAVAKALPRHLKPDRFIRIALTAITRTPALAECDQASFFQSLLSLSQYGLEPDGRRAHLIPFNNKRRGVVECQLIIDWKGLSELVYRSGLVSTLHADVVREGDVFEYSMGVLKSHVPHFLRRDKDKPKEAGDVYAVYAVATMKDGSHKCEVMSEEQIEGIRKRSRAGDSGPWQTDRAEMAKKTVFRRLSKWLPLSAELREAVEHDDDVVVDVVTDRKGGDAGSLTAMLTAGVAAQAEESGAQTTEEKAAQ
jgi:recombination protein RecT